MTANIVMKVFSLQSQLTILITFSELISLERDFKISHVNKIEFVLRKNILELELQSPKLNLQSIQTFQLLNLNRSNLNKLTENVIIYFVHDSCKNVFNQ